MNELNKAIDEAKKIIIAGHVRPDGDCIGACVALQRYIKRFYPEKNVCVYIETVPEVFQFMDDKKDIFSNKDMQQEYQKQCQVELTMAYYTALVMNNVELVQKIKTTGDRV